MDKERKMELLKRAFGLKHKLKVHSSMKPSDTHEEMAVMTVSQWEFEDEIAAIESILQESRTRNVAHKRAMIEKELKGASTDDLSKPLTSKKKKKV